MIAYINPIIFNFIKWFNDSAYAIKESVQITILNGYDTVEDDDGNRGFAVYIPKERIMLVAGEAPGGDEVLLECIAHEYVHHIQNIKDRPYDEAEADWFAKRIVKQYLLKSIETMGGIDNGQR